MTAAGKACLTLTVHTEEDTFNTDKKKGQKKAAYMEITQGGDKSETICKKNWSDVTVQN